MTHIKDFVLGAILGGGSYNWDFIEEVSDHCFDKYNCDIAVSDVEDVEHFGEVLDIFYRIIISEWEKYIQGQEKDNSIYLIIESGDGMDFDFNYKYEWKMTPEQAYKIWKENKQ